jgi:5-methylcytosine-specific restriction endonuclease McrA
MKLGKKRRAELKQKFGGHCAYCGTLLGDRWQADHVAPVWRASKWVSNPDGRSSKCVPTGELLRPENDTIENLVPACGPCNNDKFNLTLDQWRTRLEDLLGVCERNHSAFRHALRFGLLVPQPRPIVFFFETYTSQPHATT